MFGARQNCGTALCDARWVRRADTEKTDETLVCIADDGGGPDVFVHVSAVERAGMRGLAEGQKLTFDIEADRKNGKSAATNLQAA